MRLVLHARNHAEKNISNQKKVLKHFKVSDYLLAAMGLCNFTKDRFFCHRLILGIDLNLIQSLCPSWQEAIGKTRPRHAVVLPQISKYTKPNLAFWRVTFEKETRELEEQVKGFHKETTRQIVKVRCSTGQRPHPFNNQCYEKEKNKKHSERKAVEGGLHILN